MVPLGCVELSKRHVDLVAHALIFSHPSSPVGLTLGTRTSSRLGILSAPQHTPSTPQPRSSPPTHP